MNKNDIMECVDLCEEWDELCRSIRELEQERSIRADFAQKGYERRLAALRKRRDVIDELINAVMLIIDRLPSLERRLIQLRYFEKLSWQMVADELGFSVDHVKGKLHKKVLQDLKADRSASSEQPKYTPCSARYQSLRYKNRPCIVRARDLPRGSQQRQRLSRPFQRLFLLIL